MYHGYYIAEHNITNKTFPNQLNVTFYVRRLRTLFDPSVRLADVVSGVGYESTTGAVNL